MTVTLVKKCYAPRLYTVQNEQNQFLRRNSKNLRHSMNSKIIDTDSPIEHAQVTEASTSLSANSAARPKRATKVLENPNDYNYINLGGKYHNSSYMY